MNRRLKVRIRDVLAVLLLCEGRAAQGSEPRCVRCGYSLVGLKASLETRCPECGEGMTAESYPMAGEEKLPVERWVIWVARVEMAVVSVGFGIVFLPWGWLFYPSAGRRARWGVADDVWEMGRDAMFLPLFLSVVILVGSKNARDRFMPWLMVLFFIFVVLMWPSLGRA